MRPVLVPSLAVVALLVGAEEARAQVPAPHPARLTYVRSPGSAACPEEWLFRTMVSSHFGGVDPFVVAAPQRVAVTFRLLKRGGYEGVVKLYDAQDRQLASEAWTGRTCTGVAENMSILVVYWLDPFDVPPAKPAAPTPPRCEPAPAPALPAPACVPVPVPPARKPDPPPSSRLVFVVEGGTAFSVAMLPRRPGFGVVAALGLRWPAFSIALESRVDLPSATDPLTPATVPTFASVWLFSNTLAPCLHVGWFVGCGLVSGGVLMVEDSAQPITQAFAYAALGARARVELPLSSRFALGVSADVLVPLLHASDRVSNDTLWTLPSVGGDLGLRLVVTFGGP